MTVFGDKMQEIEQIVEYINAIVESNSSKWYVNTETFSCTIQGAVKRTFSRAELESYEQQIKYLLTLNTKKKNSYISQYIDNFNYYLKVLQNIRNKWKTCTNYFCYVHDPHFMGDQYSYIEKLQDEFSNEHEEDEEYDEDKFSIFPSNCIYEQKNIKDKFNFGFKNYYLFGKIILNYSEFDDKMNEQLYFLFNMLGYNQIDTDMIRYFIKTELWGKLSIDPTKIGRKLVQYIDENKAVCSISWNAFNLYDKIKKNKGLSKLFQFIHQFSDDQSILISNVPKPSHTYHLIQPSYILWVKDRYDSEYQCPQKNILFCTESSNIHDSLKNISNSNKEELYFIVHPENLKSDEMHRLKTFISTRIGQKINDDNNEKVTTPTVIPKVMIITALSPTFFYLDNKAGSKQEDSIIFDESDISEFATFNAQWRKIMVHNHSNVFLFSSNQPGDGKTHRINQIIDDAVKKYNNNTYHEDKNKSFTKDHIYLDITTQEIPESIIYNTFIHVSISPELFLNNFKLFDQLYILLQYGTFIFESGLFVNYLIWQTVVPTYLFEIPNLDDSNLFKNFYDFPIAPTDASTRWENDIYDIIKKNYDDVADKQSFINGMFHLSDNKNQLKITNENVLQLIPLIFDNHDQINTYTKLITISKDFFFKDEVNDDSYIKDNRIISKVQKMIDDYSDLIVCEYKHDEEMRRTLFLLSIRTILYVWHFTPPTSHSVVLLVPKRMMTIDALKPGNGWIFIGFYSQNDKDKKWNKGKNQIQGIDSDLALIQKIIKDFKENEQFHILSDNEKTKNNDLSLQTRFFNTLLLFLPNINSNTSSINPLNIGYILLSLFSDMNHFPKDELTFQNIITDFSSKKYDINYFKTNFEKSIYDKQIEWTKMDELLFHYCHQKNIDSNKIKNIHQLILQLKLELKDYENVWNIIKISFSKTYFARFVEIVLKVYYKHFIILQGDTGCGKTSIVRLLNDVISLAYIDPNTRNDINWKFFMIDFHGNFLQEDFDKKIKYIRTEGSIDYKETQKNKFNEKIIIFLDEFNTSPAYYYVIDHILNSSSNYFSYIGAINEYIEVDPITRKLSLVGIPQNINRQLSNIKLFAHPDDNITELSKDFNANIYAYNVKEPPKSIESAIVNADPQVLDEIESKMAKYFPDEERNTIRSIINKILLQWENNTKIDLENTIILTSELIFKIFYSVRSFLQLRAIFSYRDVHRCLTIFTYIFDYLYKNKLDEILSKNMKKDKELERRNKEEKEKKIFSWDEIAEFNKQLNIEIAKEKKELIKKITSISVVIAIYISIICRFSHEEVTVDSVIEKRFKNHPFDKYKSQKICMYKLIMNYITDECNWPIKEVDGKKVPILPYIKDWENMSILLAYAKCMKYIMNKHQIYPLPSLMLHLLILSLTVSASFKEINISKKKLFSSSDFFSCLIIGMPGTSKTKSVEIFKEYHLKTSESNNDKKHEYYITTYLCSRASESDSLLAQFMNGAWFLNEKSSSTRSKKAIVILEEVGLANYNPSRPLKILHPLCDKGIEVKTFNQSEYCKVIPIQLSNYQIDFANMNRGFLVCAGLPTDSDFYSSVAFSRILKNKSISCCFQKEYFSKTILYKISQLDEPISNYEETINLLIDTVVKGKIQEMDLKKNLKDFNNKKKFYKLVLESLWKITQDNHSRPLFFPMRPLYNLIKQVDNLKNIEDGVVDCDDVENEKSMIYKELTFILNAFIHDKNILNDIFNPQMAIAKQYYYYPKFSSYECSLLTKFLTLIKLKPECYPLNPITLFKSFMENETNKKALLIRTIDYEAFRYINLLIDSGDTEYFNVNFVPFQTQNLSEDGQNKFNRLLEIISQKDHRQENFTFIFVGNDPFSDYIIDILNSINKHNQCPTAILKGFPVYLPRFPKRAKFIFIINENEIYNHELRNPIPYPLIDRLDHLFLNKNIMKAYHSDLLSDDELDKFKVKYLLDIPLTDEENEELKENPIKTKENYLLNYGKSDINFLFEALKKNDGKILNDHFKNSSVKSLNDLIKLMKSDVNGELPFVTSIVFTRTPIYEQLIFDGSEDFECLYNVGTNPKASISNVKELKNIMVRSDIFNIPDDDTINNALSIIFAIYMKIIENIHLMRRLQKKKERKNKKLEIPKGKLLYIIVFHINKNRIPEEFGCMDYFPIIWIESLLDSTQNETLIQLMCKAIFNGKIIIDSPLLNNVYSKISNDLKEQLDRNQKKKIDALFQGKGIKLSNPKGAESSNATFYSINNIIECIIKQQDENKSNIGKQISFDSIKNEVIKKLKEIEKNLNDKKINENERNERNKSLNTELDNMNLEVQFFSIACHIADNNVVATLSIVLRYLTVVKMHKMKKEEIDSFASKTYHNIIVFSSLPFLDEIKFDTFSSPIKKKEIDPKYPELIFFNILKPYFKSICYYNSLNKMKILVQNLPKIDEMQLREIFSYINNNYFETKSILPYNYNDKSTKISIDIFNFFFDSRGLIKPKKSTDNIIDFMNITNDGLEPNLFDNLFTDNNIRNNISIDAWNKVQYINILLSDCHSNFMDKYNANNNSHPFIIYSHLLNDEGFSFNYYNNNDPKGKINKNFLLLWIINFFLYGSFNDCKKPCLDTNYINNLVNFIDIAYEMDPANFGMILSSSTEFKHFIFDYLFTELCKKPPAKKIEKFDYLARIKNENTPLKQLVVKYQDILKRINDSSISKNLLTTDISLDKRLIEIPNYDPTKYDPSYFNPFTNESIEIIRNKFKEIKKIEDSIKIYKSWKSKNIDDLANKNIFDSIRMKLFKESNDLDDMFGIWFLDPNVPLLVRQFYEICKAVRNNKKKIYEAEFKILRNLINPWNNDENTTRYLWEWFVVSLDDNTFANITNFSNNLNNNLLKDIIINCNPYYFFSYKKNHGDAKNTKCCIISKRNEIKTFCFERFLYSNTIMLTTSDKKDKELICQIFKFISNIPFVKHSKNLYIIAAFINGIMKDFRDQINLLFLVMNTCSNCTDFLNVPYFAALINDPKRIDSYDLLAEAFKSADEYRKDGNATDKLKSYINRLIDINNSTFLLPDKKRQETIHYRLVKKLNTHSYMNLTNTFLPAIAHLKFSINDESFKLLLNAAKVLIGAKNCENLCCEEKFIKNSIPSIFDYSESSYSNSIFKTIEKIEDDKDLFGFPVNDLVDSLCNEIISFMSKESNKDSYRVKIWKMIKDANVPANKPDFTLILNTLIPLFEEFDPDVSKEHLFFNWENNSMPNILEGVEAAAYFLKTYQTKDKCIFDIVEEGLNSSNLS